MSHPWETGDEFARWDGYLLADRRTLRNLVGAREPGELRYIEDALVEARALTLREHGLPRAYDLDGLKAIHEHLFQDIYEWAGQTRTVEIRKGDAFFAPVAKIEDAMGEVAQLVDDTDKLRDLPAGEVAGTLADVYGVVNHVHPFREGNGRTQREYLTGLARESGHHIDWLAVSGEQNDHASHAARTGDRQPLHDMFDRIVTHADAHDLPAPAIEAARLANLSRSPVHLDRQQALIAARRHTPSAGTQLER